MSPKRARFLTRLYPPAWRSRYGAEFQTFLESREVPPRDVANIVGRALWERATGTSPTFLSRFVHALFSVPAIVLTNLWGMSLPDVLDLLKPWALPFLLLWLALLASSLVTVLTAVAAVRKWQPVCLTVAAILLLALPVTTLSGRALVGVFASSLVEAAGGKAAQLLSARSKWPERSVRLLTIATAILSANILALQWGLALRPIDHLPQGVILRWILLISAFSALWGAVSSLAGRLASDLKRQA